MTRTGTARREPSGAATCTATFPSQTLPWVTESAGSDIASPDRACASAWATGRTASDETWTPRGSPRSVKRSTALRPTFWKMLSH